MIIRARWPFNGQERMIMSNFHWLWCLLFGPLYYMCKGMWFVAMLSLLTGNGLVIGFPIFNRSLILRHYYWWGWELKEKTGPVSPGQGKL